MRFSFTIILTLFTFLNLKAQQITQTIRGVIVDQASGAPVSFGSVVLINAPQFGVNTDSLGNFKILNVPVGRYDIQASAFGYEQLILREILVTSAKEVYLSIPLTEGAVQLNEIVLKSKTDKSDYLRNVAPVSSQMLSVEEAKRYAGGFDDPARLASSFAGVASNVSNNGIVVRGNAPKFLQWKMEGVEIPNPNHFADLSTFGGGGLTALSSQMLANSYFFTGAFPADYNNALSGVFDIFMRNGNSEKNENTIQVGLIGVDVSSEGPFKKGKSSSYLFNYRYSTLGLISPLLPEDAGGTNYQDLSFKLNFPTKTAGTFSFWGVGLIDRSGANAERDSTKWFYDQDREEQVVKQYMGATGLSHKYYFNSKTHIKTTLAATTSGLNLKTERMNQKVNLLPQNSIRNNNSNFVLSSYINKKFSSRHTNKTGIVLTGLLYNISLNDVLKSGNPPQTIVSENGFSTLLSGYSRSIVHLSEKFSLNMGVNGQVFTLNKNFTVEPRVGITWRFKEKQSLALAYGLHSRLEKLNYYFIKSSNNELINKDLDFTKAQHLVLSYVWNINENIHFKVEPYYQQLYNVPVVPNSSISFINLQNDWFFNQKLINTGKGHNYGIDFTLEKLLSKGYYFLVTTSIFNSKYKGDDGVWRDTRFNRNFLINALAGKEWQLGSMKQNIFGINFRVTYQGGDHYSPINLMESQAAKEVVYDESNAFQNQLPSSFLMHFTTSYKINRKKVAHEFALKLINVTMYKEFYDFRYNLIMNTVDENRESLVVPNLSYKIEF